MGYKYQRDDILDAAVEAAIDDGLSQLTFGRLAKRLGINDRSIVYYFPSKKDLITATVFRIGEQLQGLVDQAFGTDRVSAHDLARRAWPLLAAPANDPVFALFFELVGLGSAQVEPFDELAPMVMEAWIEMLSERIDAPTATARRAGALSAVATVDGLLLVRQTLGARAANTAAAELGLR